MKILLSIFALLVFFLCVYFGFELLESNKLSGSEFVALIIAFAVIGLVISFSSEVQEFSVAGSIVKLKNVKKDAENSIDELKSSRTETFRFLLSLTKRYPGGFGDSSAVDERLPDFWLLYHQIINFGCKEELQNNIREVVRDLLKSQLARIAMKSDNIFAKNSNENGVFPLPNKLTIEALDIDSVEKAAKRNECEGSVNKIKTELIAGLNEYRRLYELYDSVKKL